MLTNPTFLFIQALNSLALGMNLFIIASGLTLIFGLLRVVNFAHGAFFMLGAYVSFSAATWAGSFWIGLAAAVAVLAACGWAIERGLLRLLYEREPLTQLLFTFALVLILGDVAKIVWGTDQHTVSYPPGLDGAVDLGIAYFPAYSLLLCLLGPAVAAGLWLLVEHTRWGRVMRAATEDREMVAALGIDASRVYAGVFAAGAALAGAGGALAAPRVALTPGMDATVIVDCFIIVIIGGLGSLWGSFLGALLLGFVTVFGVVLLPEAELVLPYLMMVGLLLWRPWGLFGREEVERA